MAAPPTRLFRSLRGRNYRIWAAAAIVSNVGTWMQRTAQDWLVLTALTHHDATAVGIVTALQFAPLLLFLPLTGACADRFDRRHVLAVTQSSLGLLALGLGLLTVTGLVRLWEVEAFAFALGIAAAFDAPVRQSFVAELVGEEDLPNAVSLNSTSFSAARLIGPAAAGLLISVLGAGPVFLANAATFAVTLLALASLRVRELHRTHERKTGPRGLTAGARLVWARPDLRIVLAMQFLVVTFGINFQIFISTMVVSVFRVGAASFGAISSVMAVGSVAAGLLAARRGKAGIGLMAASSAAFAFFLGLAALMPDEWLFALCLVAVGIASQTTTITAMSFVQLTTEPALRGRVLALLFAVSLGGTPLGSPLVGFVADHLGPRWGMAVGVIACAAASLLGLAHLLRTRSLDAAAVPPVAT